MILATLHKNIIDDVVNNKQYEYIKRACSA